MALLRDYESPADEPIEDQDQVRFADGPVFATRPTKPHEITIIVEGTPHRWLLPIRPLHLASYRCMHAVLCARVDKLLFYCLLELNRSRCLGEFRHF